MDAPRYYSLNLAPARRLTKTRNVEPLARARNDLQGAGLSDSPSASTMAWRVRYVCARNTCTLTA